MNLITIDDMEYDLDAVTPELKEQLLLKKKMADDVARVFSAFQAVPIASVEAGKSLEQTISTEAKGKVLGNG